MGYNFFLVFKGVYIDVCGVEKVFYFWFFEYILVLFLVIVILLEFLNIYGWFKYKLFSFKYCLLVRI